MGEVEKKEGEKKRKRKRRWRSQDQGKKGKDAWILYGLHGIVSFICLNACLQT